MYKSIFLLLVSILLLSCNDETVQIDNEKIIAKRNKTFNLVSSSWNLSVPPLSPLVQSQVANWNDWQQFVIELNQKPKSNFTAFQLKTKNLAGKADTLQFTIPPIFDKPQVKSRITSLSTKIKLLDTFLNLTDVPENKIKQLIPEINQELFALTSQWEEINIKNQIPREAGEEYLIKALDTTRNANADIMQDKMNETENKPTSQPINLPVNKPKNLPIKTFDKPKFKKN